MFRQWNYGPSLLGICKEEICFVLDPAEVCRALSIAVVRFLE
jgi:hypothetical protein